MKELGKERDRERERERERLEGEQKGKVVTVIELCENFQVDHNFSNMETKYEWILAITLLLQEISTKGLILRQELS